MEQQIAAHAHAETEAEATDQDDLR
jgi:hypothetical protein